MAHVGTLLNEAVCLDSLHKRAFFYDDFEGKSLKDEWVPEGHDAFSVDLINQLSGGVVRLTTDTDLNDGCYIHWDNYRSWLASKQVGLEGAMRLLSIVNVKAEMLLYFDVTSYLLFIYDTSLGHSNWHIEVNDAGAVTGPLDTGIAADTDWHIFRIQCHIDGGVHAHFLIDDLRTEVANSPITTNISALHFEPFFYVQTNLAVTSKQMDVDYCYMGQDR